MDEPAFPIAYTEVNSFGIEFPCVTPGMTLRDYFAAQVLSGILGRGGTTTLPHKDMVAWAYETADLMLKERKK